MRTIWATKQVNGQAEQSEPYKNFINSLDSEITKRSYRQSLHYFTDFLKIDNYYDMLKLESQKLEGAIRDFIIHMRQDRKLSPATVAVRIAAISHFYAMNDIELRWKKLRKFKGKFRNVVEDRPYTREQIKKLIDSAGSIRDKAMILLMASSGMRFGAIPHLRLRDMERIDKYGLLKFNVYKKEQESYIAYCTPECTKLIDQYLRWREKLGEKFTPDTPLFRREFDTVTEVNRPHPIQSAGIAKRVNLLLEDTEIRVSVKNGRHTELMETHAFRKFFKTTCINAGMNPLYSEYVMGHRSGLTKSYFKPTDMELLEGNDKTQGYVAAINDLTINEECRLHKKIDELTKKKNEFEIMEVRHAEEIKAMRDQMSQIMSMIQHNPKLAHVKPEALANKEI
jgi:integrase